MSQRKQLNLSSAVIWSNFKNKTIPSSDNRKYMPHLDALRALAVIAVAYSHWVPKKYHFNVQWGYAGVQLFFVLSGFLITGILINALKKTNGQTSKLYVIRNFIVRRSLRIFPAYYLLLSLTYLLGIWPMLESIQWHALYVSNFYFFYRQDWVGPVSHFWSLAVEEQFYLVWPWLVFFFRGIVLKASWVIIFTSIAFLVFVTLQIPSLELVGILPIPAFLALALGSILAIFKTEGHKHLPTLLKFSAVSGFIYILLTIVGAIYSWGHPLALVITKILLILSFVWLVEKGSVGFSGVFGHFCNNYVMLKLGAMSYGLYLIHNFAPTFLLMFYESGFIPIEFISGVGGIFCRSIFTILFALISWHLIESRMNSLKKYFPYTKAPKKSSVRC